MNWIKNFWNVISTVLGFKIIVNSFPALILILGGLLYAAGFWKWVEGHNAQKICEDLGKTIVGGGFFALILKSVQFMGIFKEELTKVIFEPSFLNNRNDLPEFWEKTSKQLFKNKFPKISNKLLKDVSKTYFPTDGDSYSDSAKHLIDIKILNLEDKTIEVKHVVAFTIIPSEKNSIINYDVTHIFPFQNNANEVIVELHSIKIDGIEIPISNNTTNPSKVGKGKKIFEKLNPRVNLTITTKDKKISHNYKIKLSDKGEYKIEIVKKVIMNLSYDNILQFVATILTHKLEVDFHYPENLKVDLYKCGTIRPFGKQSVNERCCKYSYDEIIYPGQGYIAFLSLQSTVATENTKTNCEIVEMH